MSFYPTVDNEICEGCGDYVDVCTTGVFELLDHKSVPIYAKDCFGCGNCIEICEVDAITIDDI
ncbi:MAG: 4Fe-4S binding protein [Deltaproteobacteria bacterium]|nr:4Fe-4S binding protein [Deltaproteobacteria bacterium]MBW2660694.1 4Fe-4S binding protein [Deltaproteobacteria bacterium]